MLHRRRPLGAALLGLMVIATGCTSLREVPRSEYAIRPERNHVRVTTRDELVYEFDYARITGDTLTGFRERPVEGSTPEVAQHQIPLDDIAAMRVRGVDWYRTSLVGGTVMAGVLAAGLTRSTHSSSTPSVTGGGKGGPINAHP